MGAIFASPFALYLVIFIPASYSQLASVIPSGAPSNLRLYSSHYIFAARGLSIRLSICPAPRLCYLRGTCCQNEWRGSYVSLVTITITIIMYWSGFSLSVGNINVLWPRLDESEQLDSTVERKKKKKMPRLLLGCVLTPNKTRYDKLRSR